MGFGDPGDTPFKVPGNPDKGMLGGDNSSGGDPHAIAGNPAKGQIMPGDPGWPGDSPKFVVPKSADAAAVKNMFRGGSDKLSMDGRSGGH